MELINLDELKDIGVYEVSKYEEERDPHIFPEAIYGIKVKAKNGKVYHKLYKSKIERDGIFIKIINEEC